MPDQVRHDGLRGAPKRMTLKQAIAYVQDDELVQVTPKVIQIRKLYLDPRGRNRTSRKAEVA